MEIEDANKKLPLYHWARINWLIVLVIFVSGITVLSCYFKTRDFLVLTTIIFGICILIFFLIKTKISGSFPSFPELVLLIFLVPGSINLSITQELKSLKNAIGIDLNGIRLIVFCCIALAILFKKGKVDRSFLIYFVFLFVCLVSFLYTNDLMEGMRFFAKLLVPYLIFAVTQLLPIERLERINQGFLLVALLHIPFIIEILIKWFGSLDLTGDIPRASGLSGGRVILGTFMTFAFILFLYRKSIPNDRYRLMYTIFSFLAIFGIILSGARIAWLAVAFAAVSLGMLKSLRSVFLICLILVLLIILFQPLLQHRLGLKMMGGEIVVEGAGAGTASVRLSAWKKLWEENISQRIVFGNGLGSSKKLLAFTRAMDYPHNEYIRIVLEVGIIGLVLFCFSLIFLGIHLFKRCKNRLIFLPIAVFLILSLAENTLNNYFENGAMFAYLLAYISRGSRQE